MGVEVTSASSVPRTASEGNCPSGLGRWDGSRAGSDPPAAPSGGAGPGRGAMGLPVNRGGDRAGSDEPPHSGIAPPARPGHLGSFPPLQAYKARRTDTEPGDLFTPKQRVPAKTPSLPPIPSPSSGI